MPENTKLCWQIDQKYDQIMKIGEGTYGIVYRASDIKTHRIVALKKIRLDG